MKSKRPVANSAQSNAATLSSKVEYLGSTIDAFVFALLLTLFCVRPLISETLEFTSLSIVGSGGASPATTAWLDALTLAAAVAGISLRHTKVNRMLVAGIACLLAGVVVSTVFAGNRQIAALAGGSLVCMSIGAGVLGQLTSSRLRVVLLLAAFLATGVTSAAKCIAQRAYEFRDTYAFLQELKPQLVAAGHDVAGATFVNFERRILSDAAFGFVAHPNVAASCLLLWAMTAIGVLVVGFGILRSNPAVRGPTLLALLAAATLITGLWTTGSLGGMVGLLAALVLLAGLWAFRSWGSRRPIATVGLFATAYFGVIAIGAITGLARGTLPHASLAFRWFYWSAAGRALLDAPLTGIGRGNFADAFLKYKSVLSPEEVKDIHSAGLTLLVECGPLGLLGAMLIFGAVLIAALRSLAPQTDALPAGPGRENAEVGAGGRSAFATALERFVPGPFLAISGLLIILHMCSWDSATPFVEGLTPWIAGVTTKWLPACLLQVGLYWPATFLLMLWSVHAGADRPFWIGAALLAGIGGVLIHNLIDFALLVPAGMAVVSLATVAAMRMRPSESSPMHAGELRQSRQSPLVRPIFVSLGLALLAGQLFFVTLPATRTARAFAGLEDSLRQPISPDAPGIGFYSVAENGLLADEWEPSFPEKAAGYALGVADAAIRAGVLPGQGFEKALQFANASRRRNPNAVGGWYRSAMIQSAKAKYLDQRNDHEAAAAAQQGAVEAWREVLSRYPTDASSHRHAGKAHSALWRLLDDPADGRSAVRHLLTALRLDDQRPPEEINRLTPDERKEIQQFLADLREAGFTEPAPDPKP